MSGNQSKSDKNEFQYRKLGGGGRSGSSGQQRTFSGGRGGGPTAPPLVSNPSSVPASRSHKKVHNGQGLQTRVVSGSVNASSAAPAPLQNGSHSQSTHPAPATTSKPNDMATHRNPVPIPKAPSSQSSLITSASTTITPTTPAKGDGAKGFSLQFGSISPGFMNGMQVPARTTSAPPNIEELKRDQAQHAALKGAAPIPLASVPKPQVPRQDVAPITQHIIKESNAELKVKRDSPIMPAPPKSQQQKPAVPMAAIPMPVPYPQPSMPMQFSGPNPQMQSQGLPTSSLPMPMQIQLQMGNPSQVQPQMFMPGLQHHMMQPQGIMHQNPNLGFNPQMSQLPHQLGSPGMNLPPQFSPQQPVKYNNTRKAVKITHPETHEELRLDKKIDMHTDGTSTARTHHNVPPQPYSSGGFYSGSYPAAPQFFTATSGPGVPSAQMNPVPQQASRYTYSTSQAPHTVPFVSRSAPAVGKVGAVVNSTVESSNFDSSRVSQNVASSSSVLVTIKPAVISSVGKSVDSKPVEKGEAPRMSGPAAVLSMGSKPAASHGKSSATVNTDSRVKETVAKSGSVKEIHKKPVTEGHDQLSPQFGAEASVAVSGAVERSDVSSKTSSLPVEASKNISGAGHSMEQTQLEQSSAVRDASVDDVCSGVDNVLESPACDASEVVGAGHAPGVDPSAKEQDTPQAETLGTEEHEGVGTLDREKQKRGTLDVDSLKPAEFVEESNLNVEGQGNSYETGVVGNSVRHLQSSTSSHAVGDGIDRDTSFSVDRATMKASDNVSGSEAVGKVHSSGHEGDAVIAPVNADEGSSMPEKENMETARPTSSSGSVSSSNKPSTESSKTRTASARGKKNLKQILQKADAQGTTSDLYMAYKGPDEKKETSSSLESSEDTSNNELKPVPCEHNQDVYVKDKDDCSKAEPDDWEEAADVSTPKLQSLSNMSKGQDGEEAGTAKKYSRDFLLTFSEQYTVLPESFVINNENRDILTRPNSSNSSRVIDRDYPSPGRIVDRPSSGHKVDRRGSGMMDADRWSKHQGSFPASREMGLDSGYGPMPMGARHGQGGNHGVLRNPRGQPPAQYPLLSGPMHSMQRNNADGDRWRNVNFKGLMPAPQTHMHRAERKYEVGKVTDEEQAKQRKLTGILNKLTPQNFDKLFAQVKEVNIDNVVTLTGVISQIFDKALMEPTFCEMYSNFCFQLSLALPDLSVDDEKVTFKRLLLNKCQEEFERGEKEEEEANKDDSEEEVKLSDGEREERRIKARRRMLGNIRLIGELYKKKMLTERIMHECIRKLLGQYPNCGEEDIESLCKLMSTIGEMIDHPRGKDYMDKYFELMLELSNDMKLSSRVRFMLKDAIDLRKNKWQQRRKVEGPKKIEDVHRDAAQERHAQATRLNRGPSMGSGVRRGQPVDFGPRGSGMLSSPVGQPGSFRGLPQGRGYAMQDARVDDRNSFNSRTTISVPLPQRPLGDDSITLGPQGGLARGMSIRGQPTLSTAPLTDSSLSHGDTRRTASGLNGFSSMPDRGSLNSREDSLHRYTPPERLGAPQSSGQDLAATSTMNRDHKNMTSVPGRGQGILTGQNTSSDKVWPEERLREKSIAAIREYYSAKDEKEVDMCVRELNAPKCYPSVISTWITDSFERKDMERELLNKLIVNLSKTRSGQQLFMPDQLIEGFETVLTNLEESVSDAPKAPDYLGRLLATLIIENIVSLGVIGRLLYEGGEEPGRLLEEGLAGDVLGSILENIQSEKGEPVMKDMCANSKLRLKDFRPPDPRKSKKLELFI